MQDIESEITGTEHPEITPQELAKQRLVTAQSNNGESEYARQKSIEVKHSWLHHEGTAQFIAQLRMLRENKLNEAENLAKSGLTDHALRILLQSCSIKETIDIIISDIN